MEYKTWDQWQSMGYHVIKGMKATWMYLEEYGREVPVFHKGQVQKDMPRTHFSDYSEYEDHDTTLYERHYDDRPY